MTRCYVLMGVSGCGKSTVGREAALRCGMTFIDGDDLHPGENITKMARGVPLTDADREPWLRRVGNALSGADGPVIIACSALKRQYRDIIRSETREPVHFVHLQGAREILTDRMQHRDRHFMPPSLLTSQLDALEELAPDELGTRIDIAQPLPEVIGLTETYVREMLT